MANPFELTPEEKRKARELRERVNARRNSPEGRARRAATEELSKQFKRIDTLRPSTSSRSSNPRSTSVKPGNVMDPSKGSARTRSDRNKMRNQ